MLNYMWVDVAFTTKCSIICGWMWHLRPNAQLCVGGCGMLEDAEHFFISCDIFGKLWYGISHWLWFHIVFPEHVSDHLYQFGTLGGFSKSNCSTFNLIWLSCV